MPPPQSCVELARDAVAVALARGRLLRLGKYWRSRRLMFRCFHARATLWPSIVG